ncbi:MAG: hypothetical protein IIX47_03055 [Spirochaetaceae bacterium]|nr:hypothetical protein [Spirochaetaceae bacterium]
MKNRLHGKKAGIVILVSLIIISVAEIIYRAVVAGDRIYTTANLGEQFVVLGLALIILILTAMGKDRACYILYGAWIGYFVLDQVFELPGAIAELVRFMAVMPSLGGIIRILISISIIGIGVLLAEYMNDGTIYNKLFNIFCLFAVLFVFVAIFMSVNALFSDMSGLSNDMFTSEQLKINVTFDLFNNLYRGAMIFLSAFFAYDSAKKQLNKVDLSK